MMNTIFLSISEHGGWTVAFVGYSIVFMALLCLIIIFSQLPKLINLKTKADLRRKGKQMRPMFVFLSSKMLQKEVGDATYTAAALI